MQTSNEPFFTHSRSLSARNLIGWCLRAGYQLHQERKHHRFDQAHCQENLGEEKYTWGVVIDLVNTTVETDRVEEGDKKCFS